MDSSVKLYNIRNTKKTSNKMNIKEQFKLSWPLLVVVIIFILLVILSVNSIYDIQDSLFGIIYLLLAGTFSYACIIAGKDMFKKGKYRNLVPIIYGARLLSGIWAYEAINLLTYCFKD